jgi:protease I
MAGLSGMRVAVIATDGVETPEIVEPMFALRQAGAELAIVSPKAGTIQAVHHDLDKTFTIPVDRSIHRLAAGDFDAVHLPGGAVNADRLRVVPELQAFLREMQAAGKPIAAICHAPWGLVSAGLVRGRILTSFHTLQDDIRNAGGAWMDEPVVEDGNWVTSRQPADIPRYIPAMLALFARTPAAVGTSS